MLDDHTVAYLDVVGSGAETIAHLRENGRIVVMLCAFEGPPRILRLHGTRRGRARGRRALRASCSSAAASSRSRCPRRTARSSSCDVTRVADSCGYGVPLMDYVGERPHQAASSAKRVRVHGPDAYLDYQREHNAASIDGLPAVEV